MRLSEYQVTSTAVLNHVAPFVPNMMMPHICLHSNIADRAMTGIQKRSNSNSHKAHQKIFINS